jgi:methylenetetrahydrofolate reductase (NADPH)
MARAARPARDEIAAAVDLRARIMRFMRSASTEITPSDEKRIAELSAVLAPATTVHVAHPPNSTLKTVVRAALLVQRAGFIAMPHIVARRITYPHMLSAALSELRAGGVERILLVAGDATHAAGEFNSTLDVLDSGILEKEGVKSIGVAGHPEGKKAVGDSLLWQALIAKQAWAARTGTRMFIVTQFGFNANAVADWDRELVRNDIRLPVHVGIAGPTSLPKLIHFAMLCGVGASVRTLMRNLSAFGNVSDLAISPDQHVMRLTQLPVGSQVVAPHFFAFGGALQTARWIRRVAAGEFDIDVQADRFKVRD